MYTDIHIDISYFNEDTKQSSATCQLKMCWISNPSRFEIAARRLSTTDNLLL